MAMSIRKMCDLYKSGSSLTEISKIAKLTIKTISNVLIANNIAIRAHKFGRIGDDRKNRAIELIKEGKSFSQIAKEVGICDGTVSKLAKSIGCSKAQVGAKVDLMGHDIVAYYYNRYTTREISEILALDNIKITASSIQRRLKKAGVDSKRRGRAQ